MSRPLRVLIIEDSEDDALLLLRELRRGGYDPTYLRVDTAAGLRAALADGPWEVIISDHAMPQFSSLAALAIYQELGLDIPFIIVSGAIGETVAVEAMRSGAHDYVLKDNLARLTAAIERELHEAAERSARRKAELDLARAGKEWSETFDATPDLMCLLTSECRILRVNAAFARAAGAEPAALQGRDYRDVVFGGQMPSGFECCSVPAVTELVFPKLAPERTFAVTFSSIVGEDDRPWAMVQVARDVTEARQLQAQLLQSQKLAALGEIISGIAHELNNPLAAVVAHAQLLRRHHLSGEAEEAAKAVEDAALRASRVVQSLLAFSRQQAPRRELVSLNQVVKDTLALRSEPLRADDIELVVQLAPDLPAVVGDAYQLAQVLLNLINNAQWALRARPVRRLTLRTQAVNAHVELRVRDTGLGIPKEQQARIFEPFFTTREVGQGTGLGLSVCHGIVQDHGGTIAFTSQVGVGTEFVVELPAAPAAVLMGGAEAALATVPEGTRVLVVEDEMLIRLALLRMLEGLGALVDVAPDAAGALEALGRTEYQAVVCDLRMPGMDGKEFYLQATARWPQLVGRFVLCTGDTMNPDTVTFARKHGLLLLPKPFVTAEVAAAVAAAAGAG